MRSVINEARATRRFNTGDFEFQEYTLGAIVDDKETGAEVLSELNKQISEAHTGEVASKSTETKPAKTGKKEEKKNARSKSNPSNNVNGTSEDPEGEVTNSDGEGSEDDETPEAEANDNGDDSTDSGSEDGDGGSEEGSSEPAPTKGKKDNKAEAKSGKEASGKSGKKFVKKPQDYNRTIEQHKQIFSTVLGSVSPDWKKSDVLKAKAKKTSESLEGEPFLDENGEVLDSFKAMVRNHMKVKGLK